MTDRVHWEAKYQAKPTGVSDAASPFVTDSLARIGAPRGIALDLAMGEGRHALAAARAGWRVLGLDISTTAAERVAAAARAQALPVTPVVADALTFPLRPASLALVIVSRYLERALAPAIAAALAPGGWLIFETFTVDQVGLGWGPKNPDFLLEPNELPGLFPGLRVRRYEDRIDPAHGALASLLAQR